MRGGCYYPASWRLSQAELASRHTLFRQRRRACQNEAQLMEFPVPWVIPLEKPAYLVCWTDHPMFQEAKSKCYQALDVSCFSDLGAAKSTRVEVLPRDVERILEALSATEFAEYPLMWAEIDGTMAFGCASNQKHLEQALCLALWYESRDGTRFLSKHGFDEDNLPILPRNRALKQR